VWQKKVNRFKRSEQFSRLNDQETGAIIIVMQRLHADDRADFAKGRIRREIPTLSFRQGLLRQFIRGHYTSRQW